MSGFLLRSSRGLLGIDRGQSGIIQGFAVVEFIGRVAELGHEALDFGIGQGIADRQLPGIELSGDGVMGSAGHFHSPSWVLDGSQLTLEGSPYQLLNASYHSLTGSYRSLDVSYQSLNDSYR